MKKIPVSFFDPATAEGTEEEKMVVFRRVRDEIRERLLPAIDGDCPLDKDVLYNYLVRMHSVDEATKGSEGARSEDARAKRLLAAVQLLVRRFALSERADVACCGLTVAQAATLGALRDTGGLRQRELGQRLGVTASTLTRNLDRLAEAGLVERRPDPEDARAARVALTRSGIAAAQRVERQETALAKAVLGRLPVERRERVVEGLELLLGAVREATESCCPGAFEHLMGAFPQAAACVNGEEEGKDGSTCCG